MARHRIIRELNMWLDFLFPTTRSSLLRMRIGRRGVCGIWILRIIAISAIAGFIIALIIKDILLINRLYAIGASLQLLGVPLLATAALKLFVRPSTPERHIGDVWLPARNSEDDIPELIGYVLFPLLSLPILSHTPYTKILTYLAAAGLLSVVIGLILQIVAAIFA